MCAGSLFFFFKQKTAYEMRISDWSSDVCSSDLLHVRSPEPDTLPLLITHGWPGSVIEFHKVIAPLTNPAAYGGNQRDAFHLIAPSTPGYGFSVAPTGTGWGDRTSTRRNSSHSCSTRLPTSACKIKQVQDNRTFNES